MAVVIIALHNIADDIKKEADKIKKEKHFAPVAMALVIIHDCIKKELEGQG